MNKHSQQIQKQRDRLDSLLVETRAFKGSCKKCKWRRNIEYYECANPLVAVGIFDEVNGKVDWTNGKCSIERGEKPYNASWTVKGGDLPVCGPTGTLFELRTLWQRIRVWFFLSLPIFIFYLFVHFHI